MMEKVACCMWEEEEEKRLERARLFEVSQGCREQLPSSVRAAGAVSLASDEECGVWQWQWQSCRVLVNMAGRVGAHAYTTESCAQHQRII